MTDAVQKFYWVRCDGGEWEPALYDGEGYYLVTGSEMPGKPTEVGPELLPPNNPNASGNS